MTVAADRPAIRRELGDDAAVTMGEPSGRLHDTCTARLATARTARIMLVMSHQVQSPTGADGDGGAGVLHRRGLALIRPGPLLDALVTAVAGFVLAANGGSSEGTVVRPTNVAGATRVSNDYAGQTDATVTGSGAVPV